jgi:hypothetical protein
MKIFDCVENFPVLHLAMVLTVPSRSNFPSDFGKFRSHFSHEVVRQILPPICLPIDTLGPKIT